MNIIECDESMLDELYEKWALTFEGTTVDNENLTWLINWFNENGSPMIKENFYVISGKLMNTKYGLTESNAYPDNLNILSIKLEDLTDPNKLAIARFEIGGRWFNDIVDNNARHQ